jgi:arabinan endo-1,5-alpha-L-arabinosidase
MNFDPAFSRLARISHFLTDFFASIFLPNLRIRLRRLRPAPQSFKSFSACGELQGSMFDVGRSMFILILTLFSAPPTVLAQSPSTNTAVADEMTARLATLGNRGIRVHDPSTIVKCKDEYWIFYTGRGTPSYHSKDLQKWEPGPRVFSNSLPWVAESVPANMSGRDFWAPDIIHAGPHYLLYFSASSFGKNTSAIGLATNPTLDPNDADYHWSDQGIVVQSGPRDDFNTIDPAVFQDRDGSLWLTFGSFWSGIKLIQLDPATGKRVAPDSPMYSLAHYNSIEAPFIYRRGDSYFLFVNWGFCCRGIRSTYEIRVGRSDVVTGPYRDRDGKDMLVGGGTDFLQTDGPFIGPGHAGILADGDKYWFGCHFYNATQRGASMFAVRPLRWEADGWPTVALPP